MTRNEEKRRLESYAIYLEGLLYANGIPYIEYRMESGGDIDESPDMDKAWRMIHEHLLQRIQDAKDALDANGISYDENPPDENDLRPVWAREL